MLVEYYIKSKGSSWGQQFRNAVMLGPQIGENNQTIEDVSFGEAIWHFATIGWKVIFAVVPPPNMAGGWACFVCALIGIGLIVIVVAEVATLMGCVFGLLDLVTAITFVALGTSLPDTFASMTAARNSEFADSAIGNITGSNCVNVFLGLGLPYLIASIYNQTVLGQNY